MDHLPVLNPGKLLLTHMSRDMLDRLEQIDTEAAYDGLEVRILTETRSSHSLKPS